MCIPVLIQPGWHFINSNNRVYNCICLYVDKCRSPYQGGCAEFNRQCTYTELDVSCDVCISGYSEVVGSCVQGWFSQCHKNHLAVINISHIVSGLCAGLTIGTEQSFYSVRENEGSLEVCIDVLLGSIPSSDTYTISYTTSESSAEGNWLVLLLY